MPQLDPSTWFPTLFFTWVIFITMAPIKISKYKNLNNPLSKLYKDLNKPWPWPWL